MMESLHGEKWNKNTKKGFFKLHQTWNCLKFRKRSPWESQKISHAIKCSLGKESTATSDLSVASLPSLPLQKWREFLRESECETLQGNPQSTVLPSYPYLPNPGLCLQPQQILTPTEEHSTKFRSDLPKNQAIFEFGKNLVKFLTSMISYQS